MKQYSKLVLIGMCIFALNINLQAQVKKSPAPKKPTQATPAAKPVTTPAAAVKTEKITPEDMQKSWEQYMTPGKQQEFIAQFNGEWKEEVTVWMSPGTPPMTSNSSCKNEMILGGRYQQSHHEGDFNGMKFEGIGLLGYDNAKKVYQSSWIDNMGTGIMSMEGTYNEKERKFEFTGKQVDPMTGKEMNVRETMELIGDNTQVMKMFMTPNGKKEYQSMEIKFTR